MNAELTKLVQSSERLAQAGAHAELWSGLDAARPLWDAEASRLSRAVAGAPQRRAEAADALRQIAASLGNAPPQVRADVERCAAGAAERADQVPEADLGFRRAEAAFLKAGRPEEAAKCAAARQNLVGHQARQDEFGRTFRNGLAGAAVLDARRELAAGADPDEVEDRLPAALKGLAGYQQPLEWHLDKRQSARAEGDEPAAADATDHAANALARLGRYDDALLLHAEALDIYERLGLTEDQAIAESNRAWTNGAAGDHDREVDSLLRASALWRQAGQPDQSLRLGVLAGVALDHAERLPEALALLAELRSLATGRHACLRGAEIDHAAAWTLRKLGRPDEALALLQAARPLLASGQSEWLADCDDLLSQLAPRL